MHFLEIIRTVRRSSGGPAENLRSNVAGYLKLGHSAEVLTLDPPGPESLELDVPVHALGTSSRGYGYSTAARLWLRKNAHRFDGIILHGLWQYPGLLALQELVGRYPYAVFSHGMLDPWFKRTYRLKHLKKLPYWLFLERRVLANAKAVLFTNQVEADLARESFPLYRWNAMVVPFGTLGPGVSLQDEVGSVRDLVGLARDEPYLLYAGRIAEKKGCDLLLRAYASVCRDTDVPRLVMAGPDGEGLASTLQASATEQGIADRVLWPGMLGGETKWAAFREAEAFILPSHQENFGIAVAEALSVGVPVLISDQVNIHSRIVCCGAGYVEEDTLAGTEALLRRWVATPIEEKRRLSARAYDCWKRCFDSAKTSAALAQLWDDS